ncbi:hypothetical protein [Micromonospora sp. WMMD737]|uniref:hypothetical protein n=1 Tax=Micromonospora sp. WMMD737 TaxID=3404113 RepID=UPI003B948249
MADTQVVEPGITTDATPAYWRLTDAAVERLMTRLGVTEIDALATRLGYPRMTFYRLRKGLHDIRMSRAQEIARLCDWPLHDTFQQVTHGA